MHKKQEVTNLLCDPFSIMTLHVFNPEHDIALASNLSNFTAPRAGRQLRHDLSFLPLLWAAEDDVVLVDDAEYAKRQFQELFTHLTPIPGATYSHGWSNLLQRLEQNAPRAGATAVNPWGWNRALCAELKRRGINESLLPDDEQLQRFRALSHRRTATRLLAQLQQDGTVGEAVECWSVDEIEGFLNRHPRAVLKAPWSSSGRGVRVVDTANKDGQPSESQQRLMDWAANIIRLQGSIMAEPYYEKVIDFAMEFCVGETGQICYKGLSVFHTEGSAYTGNLLAIETIKEEIISRYIPVSLLNSIQKKIVSVLDLEDYRGCFGIDMMVVRQPIATKDDETAGFLLHPCVELNLRRTMGHVALALTEKLGIRNDAQAQMKVLYNGNHYQLTIQAL